MDDWLLALGVVGAGGIGVGIGLVIGAFVVRLLRRIAKENGDSK